MGWIFERMNGELVENTDELLDDMEIAAYDANGEYVETADFECDPLALAVKTGNRRIHFWTNRETACNDPLKAKALACAYFRWEIEDITEDIILMPKDVALYQYSDGKLLYIYDKAIDGDPVALAVCQRVLNHEGGPGPCPDQTYSQPSLRPQPWTHGMHYPESPQGSPLR